MPERMHGGWSGNARFGFGLLENSLDAGGRIGSSVLAFKEKDLWPVLCQVQVQSFKHFGTKHGNAVLLSFSTPDCGWCGEKAWGAEPVSRHTR